MIPAIRVPRAESNMLFTKAGSATSPLASLMRQPYVAQPWMMRADASSLVPLRLQAMMCLAPDLAK